MAAEETPHRVVVEIEPQYEDRLDAERLYRLALAVLHAEAVPGPVELDVLVTTDAEVHALNRDYLGHDYDTDVISFGTQDADPSSGGPRFVTPAGHVRHLGDVAISYDRATEQAPEYGHATDAEVALLLIHGVLHLLRYDDTTDEARSVMHARQDELLATLYSSTGLGS